MRSALQASAAFYPVSPFKIIRLIENSSDALGGPNSLPVPRQQLYDAISSNADQLAERSAAELEPHTGKYASYLRRRGITKLAALVAGSLRNWSVYAALVGVGWILTAHYYKNFPRVPHVLPALIAVSGALAASVSGASYIFQRRILSLNESLQPTASVLNRRILHEFETVALDLVRASVERRFDPLLRVTEAPTLIELESPRIMPFESFDEVMMFLKNHITSAVGVAGRRGAGKTTLLRWLAYAQEPDWIGIYISTPVIYEMRDFVRVIFDATARAIIKEWSVLRTRRGPLTRMLDQFQKISTADEILRMSQDVLDSIAGSKSSQETTKSGFAGKGLALERGRQIAWTERERGHAEWVAAYTQFLDSYRRLGGRPLVIAIDELDKLATTDEAISVINGLKDLFHIPNTHFVVSVSEDALHRFAMRGVPFRDAFDSAFDTIVSVQPPSPDDACKMLSRRVDDFPTSVALFCYSWSGGLPRDLIRIARSCVELRKRRGRAVSVSELAPPIVRRDIARAVDAAIARNLESGQAGNIESFLAVRRRIDDNSVTLPKVVPGWRIGDTKGDAVERDDGSEAIHAFNAYLNVAQVISEFFSNEAALVVAAANIDKVFSVSADLARAKAALSVHPAEAEWILAQAQARINAFQAGQDL